MNLEKVYDDAPIIEDLVEWLLDRDLDHGPTTSEMRAALLAAFDRGASALSKPTCKKCDYPNCFCVVGK
jgi:energy-converting hydrogenase Eha subunit F